MKAKDTVRPTPGHSESVYCLHCGEEFGIEDRIACEREYQAEISFKAGYEQRKDEELPYYNEERARGRKEVVEWLKAHDWYCIGITAKLKEWGIGWG